MPRKLNAGDASHAAAFCRQRRIDCQQVQTKGGGSGLVSLVRETCRFLRWASKGAAALSSGPQDSHDQSLDSWLTTCPGSDFLPASGWSGSVPLFGSVAAVPSPSWAHTRYLDDGMDRLAFDSGRGRVHRVGNPLLDNWDAGQVAPQKRPRAGECLMGKTKEAGGRAPCSLSNR